MYLDNDFNAKCRLTDFDDGGLSLPHVGRLGHTGVLSFCVPGEAVEVEAGLGGGQTQLLCVRVVVQVLVDGRVVIVCLETTL